MEQEHGRIKIIQTGPGRLYDQMRHACDRQRVVIDAAWRIKNEQIAGFRALDGFGRIVEGLDRKTR